MEHAYGECGITSTVKCRICGGNHTAALRGCSVRKQAIEVQQVRTDCTEITYAETVKIMAKEISNDSMIKKQWQLVLKIFGGDCRFGVMVIF